MQRVALAVLVSLVVTACASLGPTVRFDGWTATCSAVPTNVCEGVARLFANNLAWSAANVREASGGSILVEARWACPAPLPAWADAGSCWQATASTASGDVCMVIARHVRAEKAASTFGQVGGDEMTGLPAGPRPGLPACE